MTEKKSLSDPYDERGVRELACRIIRQAYEDFRITTIYKDKIHNQHMQSYKDSAAHFFKSRAFRQLCSTLNLQPEVIFAAALKEDE